MDFEPELRSIRPDVFVVNEDGNTPDKRKLVESLGIGYVVVVADKSVENAVRCYARRALA